MSSFDLFLSSDATIDIDIAFEYYNEQSPDLGYTFVEVIEKYFRKIRFLPTASSIRYDLVRVKPVHTFPYNFHYTIEGSRIIILRVFNTNLKPL